MLIRLNIAEWVSGNVTVAGSDCTLVEEAVAGDREALVTLLRKLTPALRSRVALRIPPRWRALLSPEDLLQETYTDAFLAVNRFVSRREGAFQSWLIQIAMRNLINAIRMLEADKRGGAHRLICDPAPGSSGPNICAELRADTNSPSQHVARSEAVQHLQAAIQRLPDTHRRVVTMYDLEGLSMNDVARALQRTPGAAHLIRLRAHRRLQAMLGTPSAFLTTT